MGATPFIALFLFYFISQIQVVAKVGWPSGITSSLHMKIF